MYKRTEGNRRKYHRDEAETREKVHGNPATVTEDEDGLLKVLETGPSPTEDVVDENKSFCQHLMGYRRGWFWDNLITPDGIEWIPEAMQRGTLTCVTDGSYVKHMAPNVSGAGWIIQDRATGKKVKGSLAEWSHSAGSYRGEMLGMLAVRVFLLAIEEYYQQASGAAKGNKVSCDNKGVLFTFDKKCKRVPAASSNADVRRALRELNRRSANQYRLEHVRGHQDKNKRYKDLSLEAQLNVECDIMAK